jgi:hypothetical protein
MFFSAKPLKAFGRANRIASIASVHANAQAQAQIVSIAVPLESKLPRSEQASN